MPPPSQLAIATSVLTRLVKEEKSYYKESEAQQARITKLEADEANSADENAEYVLRQEVSVLGFPFISTLSKLLYSCSYSPFPP